MVAVFHKCYYLDNVDFTIDHWVDVFTEGLLFLGQVKDVVDFIQNLPGCKEYAEDFALQEIDGQALMLLKADHLMSAMSMKLGPALKICAKIESMRGDRKDT